MISLEFMGKFHVEVGPITSLGAGPLGERRMIEIVGGHFEGPELRGAVLGGGADWQIVRDDGVIDLDARYALREERGGVIRVLSQGYRHGPPEVLAALGRGENVDPSTYFFRSIMRFETGAPELAWLNKTIAVARAERRAREVVLHAYKLL
jgi:hypothetical protein